MKAVAKFPFHLSILAVLICLAWTNASYGETSGAVRGTVTDPSGAVIPKVKVTLTMAKTGNALATTTDEEGVYRFPGVPFGRFTLRVEAPGFEPADFAGEVRSTAVVLHNIQFKGATAVQQITVTGSALGVGTSASHVEFDDDELEKRPMQDPNKELPAVVESVPGAVSEENGRIHLRGAETQPQYVLDGVPIAENLSSTFATALDTENLRSTEVITGNLPAEFGERTAGVINLTTKSGLEMPWNGSLSLSGGSFDSGATDAEFGGHVHNIGVFVTADASRSRRFLDPPEIDNFHNRGGVAHLFSRFDWSPSARNALHLTLATDGSDFQSPNLFEQEVGGQNLRQELRDDYQALSWSHVFDDKTSADLVLFRRSSTARLLDPNITGIPFFVEQNRRQRSEGLSASILREWNINQIKAGFEVRRVPLNEQFSLAVTDPPGVEGIDPEAPIFDFTPSSPFQFSGRRTGVLSSAFVEDRVRLGANLTIDAGLRFDHPDLVVHDNALSPRIGFSYRISRTNTVLHAAYNRLFQIPPIENILLSSSPATAVLEEVAPGDMPRSRVLGSERQNHYQFGLEQQFGKWIKVGVVRYVKNINHALDDQQLFETAIVFPVALAHADIRGTEVRIDLASIKGWTGYASYANARATVTAPLVGGLFLGDAGEFAAAGEKFPADSDERNEGQMGVSYTNKSGFWGALNARYDSGVPTDFAVSDFSSFDPRIQNALDPVRLRIKPRTVLNFAMGTDLLRESSFPISLEFGVNNLTDRFYLYNFQSAFSGTHIGRPREIMGRITFHWKSK